MKNKGPQYFCMLLALLFLESCSTEKDTFLSRNYHALTTKYNVLYNGQIVFDRGMIEMDLNTKDNFWKRLPVEKMQVLDDTVMEVERNANFELAETKATKAIQKHSMNIDGTERNRLMDDAYLMLGKARYYDQRFVPALDAFNYILYKYTDSNRIYEARIWTEKVNIRLGNEAPSISNLEFLIEEKKLKRQLFADANAVLAEAYLRTEQKDSAIAKLEVAQKATRKGNERARYRFILGQLYQEKGKKDEALSKYQSVIDLNRRANRVYMIQAYIKKAQMFDVNNGDKAEFVQKYTKGLKNRENRPFLDVLHHQMANFYNESKDPNQAEKQYKLSLRNTKDNPYLNVLNYKSIANICFKKTNFVLAAKYYDSTLVNMKEKNKEFFQIERIRKSLDDVIKYEALATRNDSVLKIVALSKKEQITFFGKHIERLRKEDERRKLAEKNTALKDNNSGSSSKSDKKEAVSNFYFYNPTTVAFGQVQFKKTWEKRTIGKYWRIVTNTSDDTNASDNSIENQDKKIEIEPSNDKYQVAYYLKRIPTQQKQLDSVYKERNFAEYQLGVIYKERFKEYPLASTKLEKVLRQNKEDTWTLPAAYHLYKIYQVTKDDTRKNKMRDKILKEFPNSLYAKILRNSSQKLELEASPTDKEYDKFYKLFKEEQYVSLLEKLNLEMIKSLPDEVLSKYKLLRANIYARLFGLVAYKKELQELTNQHPSTEDGKLAQEILKNQIPILEKVEFDDKEIKSWKIIFKIDSGNQNTIEEIRKSVINIESSSRYKITSDAYSDKEKFIAIHNIETQKQANELVKQLKTNKLNIAQEAIIISNENYRVVQIKKNLESYLALKNQ